MRREEEVVHLEGASLNKVAFVLKVKMVSRATEGWKKTVVYMY